MLRPYSAQSSVTKVVLMVCFTNLPVSQHQSLTNLCHNLHPRSLNQRFDTLVERLIIKYRLIGRIPQRHSFTVAKIEAIALESV
jgi:hypothetical protein